jgi:hypothetical protein
MRASVAAILLASSLPLGLQAQIPPRHTVTTATGAPRVVVATPSIEDGLDRALAVDLTTGFRERLARSLGGRYQVVSREVLSKVLASSGYDADAPLSEAAVRALGTQLRAALVFAGSLRQGADGRLTVSASLAPPSDPAPRRVNLTQGEGQDATMFGAALAEQLTTELR